MSKSTRQEPGTHDRRRSRFALVLLALPLLLGSVAEADERQANLLGMHAIPCPVRLLGTEHACPGCGLTRGTALAMHGEIHRSWNVHPAGLLVALLCAAGVAVHLHILARRERRPVHDRLLRHGHRVFVVGLFAAWLTRLIS